MEGPKKTPFLFGITIVDKSMFVIGSTSTILMAPEPGITGKTQMFDSISKQWELKPPLTASR